MSFIALCLCRHKLSNLSFDLPPKPTVDNPAIKIKTKEELEQEVGYKENEGNKDNAPNHDEDDGEHPREYLA